MSPQIFIDIKSGGSKRINFSRRKIISVKVKSLARFFLILFLAISFIFGSGVKAPGISAIAQTNEENEEKRRALEAELAEYEKQIEAHEATISQLKKQGKSLESEVKRLNNEIAKFNLQIKAINLSLEKLDKEIKKTQTQIEVTESDIGLNKRALSKTLQNMYESESSNLLEVLMANPKLSDFFGNLNNLLAVQENLKASLKKIIELRQRLIDEKEQLGLERADAEELKNYRASQKATVQKTQNDKTQLLKTTRGKESEYQKLLTETKKTAAEIRKQIFSMLGGGELEFEEAYRLAKLAEAATGVRAALILAVLNKESALGRNVGRCDYQTAMHPTRDIPIFLKIIDELGLRKSLESGIIKVSCPNADGAFGGAMGPAQFIPSTWNIYEKRISEATGNNPPSPWNNGDAFMAVALYLKDAGAGSGASLSQERKAAAQYYAGSRWSRYLWTYGERVIAQARRFEEDIAVLSS